MNILTYIYEKTKYYHNSLFIVFLIIMFLGVGTWVYRNYFRKVEEGKKFTDVANATDRNNIVEIYFFFVDWCPHCKTAKPEWDQFKREHNGKKHNGSVIKCYDINCTEDNGEQVITMDRSDPKNPETTGLKPTPVRISDLIRKHKIDSYPTIKLMKGDTVVDFEAKITEASLTKFIDSVA